MTPLWSLLFRADLEMPGDGLGGNARSGSLADGRVERPDEDGLAWIFVLPPNIMLSLINDCDVAGQVFTVWLRFYGVTKSGNAIAQSVGINVSKLWRRDV